MAVLPSVCWIPRGSGFHRHGIAHLAGSGMRSLLADFSSCADRQLRTDARKEHLQQARQRLGHCWGGLSPEIDYEFWQWNFNQFAILRTWCTPLHVRIRLPHIAGGSAPTLLLQCTQTLHDGRVNQTKTGKSTRHAELSARTAREPEAACCQCSQLCEPHQSGATA